MEWALFYADGSAFTDEDGPPADAPRVGVQLSVWKDGRTGWNYEKSDVGFWVWRKDMGHWLGMQNEAGWWDHLFHYPDAPLTVFGRTLEDGRFGELMLEAARIMEGPKTSWRRIER